MYKFLNLGTDSYLKPTQHCTNANLLQTVRTEMNKATTLRSRLQITTAVVVLQQHNPQVQRL